MAAVIRDLTPNATLIRLSDDTDAVAIALSKFTVAIDHADYLAIRDPIMMAVENRYVRTKHKYVHETVAEYHLSYEGDATIDHIDRNGHDNRLRNLRVATQSEQNFNQHRSRNDAPDELKSVGVDKLPRHVSRGWHGDRSYYVYENQEFCSGVRIYGTKSDKLTDAQKLCALLEEVKSCYDTGKFERNTDFCKRRMENALTFNELVKTAHEHNPDVFGVASIIGDEDLLKLREEYVVISELIGVLNPDGAPIKTGPKNSDDFYMSVLGGSCILKEGVRADGSCVYKMLYDNEFDEIFQTIRADKTSMVVTDKTVAKLNELYPERVDKLEVIIGRKVGDIKPSENVKVRMALFTYVCIHGNDVPAEGYIVVPLSNVAMDLRRENLVLVKGENFRAIVDITMPTEYSVDGFRWVPFGIKRYGLKFQKSLMYSEDFARTAADSAEAFMENVVGQLRRNDEDFDAKNALCQRLRDDCKQLGLFK